MAVCRYCFTSFFNFNMESFQPLNVACSNHIFGSLGNKPSFLQMIPFGNNLIDTEDFQEAIDNISSEDQTH